MIDAIYASCFIGVVAFACRKWLCVPCFIFWTSVVYCFIVWNPWPIVFINLLSHVVFVLTTKLKEIDS